MKRTPPCGLFAHCLTVSDSCSRQRWRRTSGVAARATSLRCCSEDPKDVIVAEVPTC